ncbi:MAG TPA: trypsin-like serine protease [Bacteriovoracaceae bacterium]|nr:trypsin-like serine protease [Bacteriovoracaceae bacterium]
MVLLFLSLLVFLPSQDLGATAEIDGGTPVTDKNSSEYLRHIQRITWRSKKVSGKNPKPLPVHYDTETRCTTTQIGPEWFITAAHCIVDAGSNALVISGYQIIAAIPHPDYVKHDNFAKKNKLPECRDCVKNDVGLLRVKSLKPLAPGAFPALISAATTFTSRRDLRIAGYGANKLRWNGHDYEAIPNREAQLYEGANVWEECDSLNQANPVKSFIKDVSDVLYFNADRIHYISGRAPDAVAYDKWDNFESGKASFLPGDSGGPIIELDASGKPVITGIASAMQNFVGRRQIEVADENGVSELIDIDEEKLQGWPGDQWRLETSENENFKDLILEHLKKSSKFPTLKAEIEKTGELPKKFSILRLQHRTIKNHVTNLASAANQAFIEKVIKHPIR